MLERIPLQQAADSGRDARIFQRHQVQTKTKFAVARDWAVRDVAIGVAERAHTPIADIWSNAKSRYQTTHRRFLSCRRGMDRPAIETLGRVRKKSTPDWQRPVPFPGIRARKQAFRSGNRARSA